MKVRMGNKTDVAALCLHWPPTRKADKEVIILKYYGHYDKGEILTYPWRQCNSDTESQRISTHKKGESTQQNENSLSKVSGVREKGHVATHCQACIQHLSIYTVFVTSRNNEMFKKISYRYLLYFYLFLNGQNLFLWSHLRLTYDYWIKFLFKKKKSGKNLKMTIGADSYLSFSSHGKMNYLFTYLSRKKSGRLLNIENFLQN